MSFEQKGLSCRNCKFWWPVPDGGQPASREHSARGGCRRHAPPPAAVQQVDASPRYPSWALTQPGDWCGEHLHVGATV
jgi:hypothetical protein